MRRPKTKRLIIVVFAALLAAIAGWFGVSLNNSQVKEVVEETINTYTVQEEQVAVVSNGTVTRVIDGDTIRVQVGSNEIVVRVIGIDTPEVKDSPEGEQCYGTEASNYARELLLQQPVTLRTDLSQDRYDKYERLLAYVEIGGKDFGEQMILGGFAREYTFIKPYQKQSLYKAAEQRAQSNQAGLWLECT